MKPLTGILQFLQCQQYLKKFDLGHMTILALGPISLPATELHTSSTWYSFDVPEGWTESGLTDAMTGAAYAIQSFIPLVCQM